MAYWRAQSRWGKRAFAAVLVASVLLVAATVIGTLGSGDNRSPRGAIEGALGKQTLYGQFPQLNDASDISCRSDGDYIGHQIFDCTWIKAGEEGAGRWVMQGGADYDLARVSEGGDYRRPPLDAKDATDRVNDAIDERTGNGEGSVECTKHHRPDPRDPHPHTYLCSLLDEYGSPIVIDGTEMIVQWTWNDDGTVAREQLYAGSEFDP